MRVVRPFVGAKDHLAWHANWHKVRTQKDWDAAGLITLRTKGYLPDSMTDEEFAKHLIYGDKFGEDFLYMHRMMLKMVQLELAANGLDCIAPWTEIPAADDKLWPVPQVESGYSDADDAERSLAMFRKQLNALKDPSYLKSVTLNKLGLKIEPVLHQSLHNFYSSIPACSPEAKTQGFCDDLLPIETSPLNKHFWKIHGLVDSLVGDWLQAHDYKEISIDCGDRAACYQWQGTWVGKYPARK
jgi:hypothetical protein